MSGLVIAGDNSGSLTLNVPANAGNTVLNLPSLSGTLARLEDIFPVGTRLAFQQTTAPAGWTKDTSAAINDSVLRLVTGTVGSGGSTAFSTFNAQSSVGATTLSTAQMPSHTHTFARGPNSTGQPQGAAQAQVDQNQINTSAVGGGGSHTHSITTAIKYYDFIIASKD